MLPRGRLARQRVSFAPVSTSLRRSLAVSSGMMRTAPRRPKPLAERVLPHLGYRGGRTRTCNPRFWRPVLCQLSYAPRGCASDCSRAPSRVLAWLRPRQGPRSGRSFSFWQSRSPGSPRPRPKPSTATTAWWCSSWRPGPIALWLLTLALRNLRRKPGLGRILSPMAADETQALWREYAKSKDQGARDRLILTYAPLVKYVAGRLGSGLPAHVDENDLVSYGLLGPDRGDRALRPEPGHQVRDLRHRAHQGLDHRRAARDGLGSPLGPISRARHRAGDRGARAQAPPRADRRGDRGEARSLDRRSGTTA